MRRRLALGTLFLGPVNDYQALAAGNKPRLYLGSGSHWCRGGVPAGG